MAKYTTHDLCEEHLAQHMRDPHFAAQRGAIEAVESLHTLLEKGVNTKKINDALESVTALCARANATHPAKLSQKATA